MPLLLVAKANGDECIRLARLSVDQSCGLRFRFATAYEINFTGGHAD
ncbi:MAG TPA: hypothetical protein VGL46_21350 [Pseudonocardiaceae bacterium]